MTILRVERTGDTRVGGNGTVIGRGVRFPDGTCVLWWDRGAFPPENRLENPHHSVYGSLSDVEQGTGGKVVVETEV